MEQGTEQIRVIHGDCLDVMRTLDDASVDAVVTDPPYELGFMGRRWDSTGIAYSVELWREALRVLKPGGHLLAFGGSRTYHRMAVAIEDAGFEIRDCIMWLYGSGFPKSHDVSKAIDRMYGAERPVVGEWSMPGRGSRSVEQAYGLTNDSGTITAPATPEAERWDGWGTALKPAHEPIVVARAPMPAGVTVAANVLEHGTGALNIDGCRVPTTDGYEVAWDRPVSTNISAGAFVNPESRHTVDLSAYRPSGGRWPANVVHDGSAEVLERFPNVTTQRGEITRKPVPGIYGGGKGLPAGTGTYGFDESGSAARFFYTAKASRSERDAGLESMPARATGMSNGAQRHGEGYDKGQDIGLNRVTLKRNHHPTVKPLALMRWLVRLVTPPGGVVLDPFAGSGTTGLAARAESMRAILVEREAEYIDIIRGRLGEPSEDPEPDDLPVDATRPRQLRMTF
jgi:DNA modification methylase